MRGHPGATAVEHLARLLAAEIMARSSTIHELATRFRHRLELLGKLRPTSTDETARRRLQEFLSDHVYGVLIPEDELPPRIRSGRRTGGQRGRPTPE